MTIDLTTPAAAPFATEMANKADELTTRADRLRDRMSELDVGLEPLRLAMHRRAAELDFVSTVLSMRADALSAASAGSRFSMAS